VTCLCALLDPSTGHLVYANAGHSLPYLRTGGEVKEVRARGMPLGLMPEAIYDAGETTIAPGDGIVFHSDGLAEARNSSKEMFGLPRMKKIIASCPVPGATIQSMLNELKAFTGEDWEQEDDITLAVFHSIEREARKSGGPGATRGTAPGTRRRS
jgi:serine phosphatase RsbU (regulator of sigma subunit)